MSSVVMPFADEKIHQFVAQFAHRIPTRKQLTTGERKALENVLKALSPEFFQLFDESSTQNPASLFQVLCQHPVEATQVTLPSFILSNDSFSFIHPVRMLRKFISGSRSFDTSDHNQKMLDWSVKVQDAISNLRCQRAGKIYEIVLGPFHQEDKIKIFQKLFSVDLNEIGEINLSFANYRNIDGEDYNIQTVINYSQIKLGNPFQVNLRIDINNRNLQHSMEPHDIKKVWDLADTIIAEHLANILVIE